MNYRLWSARGAIFLAPLFIAQVVARNWAMWEWWPFWADDLAAVILLLIAGYLSLENDTTTNSRLLTGAWFFAAATQWVAMFGMLTAEEATSAWVIVLTLATLVGSALGAVTSLPSKRPSAGHKPASDKPPRRHRSRSRPEEEA